MAAVVGALDPRPALVLCSTAVRAQETLELVRDALDTARIVIDESLYAFDPRPIRLRLAQIDDTVRAVLVIGHNPALERLAADLTRKDTGTPARRLREKFPTAALAALDLPVVCWADVGAGLGRPAPALDGRVTAFTRPADLDPVTAG